MPLRKKISRILHRFSGKSPAAVQPAPKTTPISVEKEQQDADDSARTHDKLSGLVLYGRPSCPYCARVDRVIEELNIADQITRRLTTYGSEWRTDLRNRTGRTQVPCLFIDGEPMFESLDIIDWMRSNLTH